MSKVIKRTICGVLTIAFVLSLVPNIGIFKKVEAANTVDEVVNVAIGQEGYIEKASNAMLDDKTANAGSGNYTKYHRDLGVEQGQAWCAYFVRWVLQTAGVPSSEYPTSGYVPTWQQFYKDRGRYHERGTYIAKPGDLVIIRTSEGPRGHIGIVVLADSVGFFYTSGNTGNNTDRVARSGWMSQTDSKVTGWCEMSYNNDSTPPVISNVKITNVSSDGYVVECDITDNVGVASVKFPTWPAYYTDASKIEWFDATGVNGNHYSFRVRTESFGYYQGQYATHIYAYDAAGNCSSVGSDIVKIPKLPQNQVYQSNLNEHKYILVESNCLWSDARDFAKAMGGHLVTIESNDELDCVNSLINKGISSIYWIGATDESSEGSFKWVTGEGFSNFGGGHYDNAGGVEHYLGIWQDTLKWNDFPNTFYLSETCGYIVELEPEVTQVSGTLNGHEYIVYKDSLTATEARTKEGDEYHLATITSADEYNFIMSLTKKISKQPEGYWFGANDNIKESAFVWETGEPFVYDLWPTGQPDNNGGDLGDENYFGIWSSGVWNDFPEAYKLGYVLEKDPPASTASGTLGDHEYMISAAYMTRAEAEEYQKDGWYLATITSSAERDYVVSLINGLAEKNLNGYWLGGNDVGHEGTFVWENGEEFSYAPWEGGGPNNENRLGQDENYLALLNNGNFNDDNESYRLGYVLERDPESKVTKVDTINLTSNRDETKDAYEGDTFQLSAEVLPTEATDKTVTWTSSDTDYAMVDTTGYVTVNSTIPNTVKTIIITATNSDGTVGSQYTFVVCPRSSCDHTWGTGSEIKESTCSEYGEEKYTCSKCGTTKIESIEKKAHTLIDDDEVLATCENEGKTKGSHCSVCGKIISEQETVPALGHSFGDYIPNNDETCIANGTATAECTKCGKKASITIEGTATGVHIWSDYEVINPATCTSIGVKIRKCINCTEEESVGIAKLPHDYEEEITKEATYTETGIIKYTCKNCGDSYEEDIPTLVRCTEHSWNEGEISKEATCAETGEMLYTCTVCGDTKTETIEKKAHTEETIPAVTATCTEKGSTAGTKCSVCGEIINAPTEVSKLGHSYGQYVYNNDATCSADGTATATCSRCQAMDTITITGSATGLHDWGEYEVTTEPTCITVGVKTRYCKNCGKKSTLGIPLIDHNYVEEVQKESTCAEAGILKKTCSICGDEKYEAIAKKNHTIVVDKAVAATTTSTGLTEGSHCSVCSTVINAQQEVPMLTDESTNGNNNTTNQDIVNNGNQGSANNNTQSTSNTGTNNTKKYSNEWVNGKWYDINGNQTYEGTLQWKGNATGYWVEDSSGWYPSSSWQKIDGVWYYFKPDGYMASSEYFDGYWFNKDGSWDDKYLLSWKSNSTGWWVEDKSGWWPSNSWLKIDGYWYYFKADGYMATSQYVDGYWINASGVCE